MTPEQSKTSSPFTQAPSTETLLHSDRERSYVLDLGAGLSWCVSAPEEAQPLLERLASVLGIRPGSSDAWPRLILGSNPASFRKRHVTERIPTEGWRVTEFADSRIWSHATVKDVFCEFEWNGNPNGLFRMWTLLIHSIYSRAIANGGLPVHAALIEREGIGIALVGASGRGKSTCCRRIPTPWRALSDDHTLVLAGECQGFETRPFPTWGDVRLHERITLPRIQNKVALSAIFFLEQTRSDEVESVGQGEAAVRICQSGSQIFWSNLEILENAQPRIARTRLFENACNISKAVKTYILGVSLKGRFWDKIDAILY